MESVYDVVVLGTGSAGSGVAYRCRKAGWRVAIVDNRPFGGTCALRGCDPKKVLVGAAEIIERWQRMQGKGVRGDDVRIDWKALMQFKRTFTEPVPAAREEGFRRAGIETFRGTARFVAGDTVAVDGHRLQAKYIVIATGARPRPLEFPGAEYVITSDDFLELNDLPQRVTFIGGGYISFEFAHIAARAGARPVILHRSARPLVRFEPDLVARLVEASRDAGVDVRVKAPVRAVEKAGDGFRVIAGPEDEPLVVETDLVVHGAGRVPNIADLDLDRGRVEAGPRGVKVNEFLQSVSNPRVYAAGDCADSGPNLTPVAGREGAVVARNLLEGNRYSMDYRAIPSVVFTLPPLASVGLHEAQARERGFDIEIKQGDTSGWYASRRINEPHSAFKVIIDRERKHILGAHLLGSHAEEVINLFAMAMRYGLTTDQVKEMFYAYPTVASNLSYMV